MFYSRMKNYSAFFGGGGARIRNGPILTVAQPLNHLDPEEVGLSRE